MTRRHDRRIELLLAVLGSPAVATVAWRFDLRLAGAVLWAVWAVVVVLYVADRLRPPAAPTTLAVPVPAPVPPPSTVDPAAAFLEALGEDITYRRRP